MSDNRAGDRGIDAGIDFIAFLFLLCHSYFIIAKNYPRMDSGGNLV